MYDALICSRSGSLNLSPALNVLSNTARVNRLRILMRTSVCPPRAVGFEMSTSMQWYGAPSCSKNILRLISIASIWVAIGGFRVYNDTSKEPTGDRGIDGQPPQVAAIHRRVAGCCRISSRPRVRTCRGGRGERRYDDAQH